MIVVYESLGNHKGCRDVEKIEDTGIAMFVCAHMHAHSYVCAWACVNEHKFLCANVHNQIIKVRIEIKACAFG